MAFSACLRRPTLRTLALLVSCIYFYAIFAMQIFQQKALQGQHSLRTIKSLEMEEDMNSNFVYDHKSSSDPPSPDLANQQRVVPIQLLSNPAHKPSQGDISNLVYLINQPHICTPNEDTPVGPYLLLEVHSHPSRKPWRDAIRETWGKVVRDYDSDTHVQVVFLTGLAEDDGDNARLKKEAKLFRDIIQADFVDHYENLTKKSLMGLSWASVHCPHIEYMVKMDDDVYLNVTDILQLIQHRNNSAPLLIGSRNSNSDVQRHGQWRVSEEQYPATKYPPYCSGAVYLMSKNTMNKLTNRIPSSVKFLLPFEDISITGILANHSGIQCEHSERFPSWTTTPTSDFILRFLQGELLGVHGMSFERMYVVWQAQHFCSDCSFSLEALQVWMAGIEEQDYYY